MKRVRSYLCNCMHTLPLTIEIFVFHVYCMLCTSLAPSSIRLLAMFARNPLVSLWLSWRMWKIARDSGLWSVLLALTNCVYCWNGTSLLLQVHMASCPTLYRQEA